MSWRPKPKYAQTDPDWPRAWATCDRSGFVHNHADLRWEYDWAGTQLVNRNFLVGRDFEDTPQEQLRAMIIPVDPEVLLDLRPENYVIDETDYRVTQTGDIRSTQDDKLRVVQSSETEAETETTE